MGSDSNEMYERMKIGLIYFETNKHPESKKC